MKKTEYKLTLWREGQPNAERFSADLLILDGFVSVSPQSPLGGPDGLKDVVCEKNGWKYIGACYFPTTQKNYTAIKNKFIHDFDGVAKNSADGIVFITNQSLTPKQKSGLAKIAASKSAKCIIYDNERIRVLIDSPIGFALRLQYLRIKMNKEEQLAFFAQQQNKLNQLLNLQTTEIISEITKKIDECCKQELNQEQVLSDFISSTQSTLSNFINFQTSKSDKKNLNFPTVTLLTEELTIDNLCNIQKLLLYEFMIPELGKLRSHQVWIGSSKIAQASYIPPSANKVYELTDKLLSNWRENYKKIKSQSKDNIIKAISKFHGDFLSIHPFMDGNGRVARFLLNQQVSELLGIERKIIIEDRQSYFSALTEAQNNDYSKLELLIKQAIYGEE
jgi:fido (protein-threonine AMPylation protein)